MGVLRNEGRCCQKSVGPESKQVASTAKAKDDLRDMAVWEQPVKGNGHGDDGQVRAYGGHGYQQACANAVPHGFRKHEGQQWSGGKPGR